MTRFGTIAIHLTVWMVVIVGPCFAGSSSPSGETHISAKDQSTTQIAPKAVFPIKKYSFGEVNEGTKVKYDFVVENQGDAPLVIKNIRPD